MGIKVSKAIELLKTDIQHPTASFMPDLVEAEKLGIEALKRVKECGHPARCGLLERLPGEDPEEE